jgi:hypothetical protein
MTATGWLRATEAETSREEVVLAREKRAAKHQTANLVAEIVGRRAASARDGVALGPKPEQQLPLQEVVVELSFLPAHSHQLAAPQTLCGDHLFRRARNSLDGA